MTAQFNNPNLFKDAKRAARPKRMHVFIIDGTLSTLEEGKETNAGLLYKVLKESGPKISQTVGYDAGVQAQGFRKWWHVALGTGINRSIVEGYGTLCSRYEPGDKIMLFGYSRGAYAVRSLAGFIDRVGLLHRRHATERRIQRAFRYYEAQEPSEQATQFTRKFCHRDVEIEMLGIWDCVKALGLPYPILSYLAPMATEFHSAALGPHIRNGFHALAIDENRVAYAPRAWSRDADWQGHLEQVWFPGTHSDIGGQVCGRPHARGLSNIPLRWMLEKAQGLGLELPDEWQSEFPINIVAPSSGAFDGSSKLFIHRRSRCIGTCASESVHPSVQEREAALAKYRPRAREVAPAKPVANGSQPA